jgi:hypothetical protein
MVISGPYLDIIEEYFSYSTKVLTISKAIVDMNNIFLGIFLKKTKKNTYF